MSKVIFDISISLDGFMTAAGQRPDEPMGEGGLRLVEWAFGGDERDRQVLSDGVASAGAVIAGRRTYDTSVAWWGADGPTGPARLPVFVLTRSAGTRIFERLADEHIELELTDLIRGAAATHLRFRVVKREATDR
jgi:hypothetical protein